MACTYSWAKVITVAMILHVFMALVMSKDTCMISLGDDYCGGNLFWWSYERPVQFPKNFGVPFLRLIQIIKYGKIFVHEVTLFSVMWIFDKQFCLIIQTWHTKCWGNSYKALFTLLSVDTFIFKACFYGWAALFVVISRFDNEWYLIMHGGHTACVL